MSRATYFVLVVVGASAFTVSGCGLALYLGSPASSQRVKVIAERPELYWIEIDAPSGSKYDVPADGKLDVQFPHVPNSCQGLLFDVIPVTPKPGPAKFVLRRGWWTTVREWDFYEFQKLPLDAEGYRLVSPEIAGVDPEIAAGPAALPPEKLRP